MIGLQPHGGRAISPVADAAHKILAAQIFIALCDGHSLTLLGIHRGPRQTVRVDTVPIGIVGLHKITLHMVFNHTIAHIPAGHILIIDTLIIEHSGA